MLNLLRFLRFPGVFSALADILTGFFIVKLARLDELERMGTLPYVLGVGVCFYLAGMAWNDLFDAEEDAVLRPGRPIPSGAVNMTTGFFTASILSLAGLMLAMAGGLAAFFTAALLLLTQLLYNAVLKRNSVLGPIALGTSRGLNLFLGMCAHTYILFMIDDPRVFLPPLFLACFATILTVISRMEYDATVLPKPSLPGRSHILSTELEPLPEHITPPEDPEEGMRLSELRRKHDLELLLSQNKVAQLPQNFANLHASDKEKEEPKPEADPFLLWMAAAGVFLVPAAGAYVMAGHWLGLVLFVAFALWMAKPVYEAVRKGTGESVKRVGAAGIAGICLLDAAFIASVSHNPLGQEPLLICGVVALMLLPTAILRNYINVP